jgi:hypothetical protein
LYKTDFSPVLDRRAVEKSRENRNSERSTLAMAANEVFASVADVASCDLLDFIKATGRACSLSTTSVNRQGPASMPRAEPGIHGLNR